MPRKKGSPSEKTLDLFDHNYSPNSTLEKKLVNGMVALQLDPFAANNEISYQHSVLCQTSLPYRNPKGQTEWLRKQGNATLLLQSGKVVDKDNKIKDVGLPYGPKARLILLFINKEAVRNKTRVIEVGKNLSAFMNNLSISKNGRNSNIIKDQLYRLKKCTVNLSFSTNVVKAEKDSYIIEDYYNLLDNKTEGIIRLDGRNFRDSAVITLSEYYYNSLIRHAVPLDERAINALANNAMALDIYSWLAHRLYRVDPDTPSFLAWKNLYDQFGQGFNRIDNFKAKFRSNLAIVSKVYPSAKVAELGNRGFHLYNSQPPIHQKIHTIGYDSKKIG